MRIYDFIYIRQRHSAVPNCFGINHQVRTMFALVQASRLVCANSSFQASLCQVLFEQFLQLCPAHWIAASARMPRRTYVSADEDVALKFRHGTMVQGRQGLVAGHTAIGITTN